MQIKKKKPDTLNKLNKTVLSEMISKNGRNPGKLNKKEYQVHINDAYLGKNLPIL
jgi:hypothetical protein